MEKLLEHQKIEMLRNGKSSNMNKGSRFSGLPKSYKNGFLGIICLALAGVSYYCNHIIK